MKSVIRITTFILVLLPVTTTTMGEFQITTLLSISTITLITALMIEMALQSFSIPHSWSEEKSSRPPLHPDDRRNESESLQKVA